jgi:IMP dehydrogenase
MRLKKSLSYDDVLLVPKYSTVTSRSQVDTSVKLGDFTFNHPIIPANMKTISGIEMVECLYHSKGLGILHRFSSIQDQVDTIKNLYAKYPDSNNYIAVSVGVKQEDKENISKFLEAGVKIFCIDVAHGDSIQCVDMITYIKSFRVHPAPFVIAGNVATGSGALRLWTAGADVVKVGIGPGSLCSTRVETGNGVAQLSAIEDVFKYREDHKLTNKYIISDGGIKFAGDIVKGLCFSEMVMVGNLFSGTNETPGPVLNINGTSCKEYVGSSTHKTTHIEGVAAVVPTKGSAIDVLDKLLQGIKSGCSYQGCNNIKDLQIEPEFIEISSSGLKESHPHNQFTITK